ncbi:MAG TPA: TetR/AcrR family transcriptional regulator [Drouetiella sp.]
MRRSVEATAETRKSIISTAAREFRKNGEKLGLADIMGAAGLTNGAFYRHFASKEELFAESVAHALDSLGDKMEQSIAAKPDSPLATVIGVYLSCAHRDNVSGGCPLAALGSEIARAPKKVRGTLMHSYKRVVGIVAACLSTGSEEERRATAEYILASMAGLLTMSRVVCDKDESSRILEDGVRRLIQSNI